MTTSIPVIGIPVLNRGDLLMRCVESIDYPHDKLVIINNGFNPSVDRACNRILSSRKNSVMVANGHNIGVAASWNMILSHKAPFHFICANDIQFARGDLSKMVASRIENQGQGFILGNHGMSFFLIDNKAIEAAGTFDENFHPAYMEDCDWIRRLRLSGRDQYVVPGVNAIHGEPPSWGSSTIFSNKEYRRKNGITHGSNSDYYQRKWGGQPGEEVFDHPFNDPAWPITKWVLEEDRVNRMRIW